MGCLTKQGCWVIVFTVGKQHRNLLSRCANCEIYHLRLFYCWLEVFTALQTVRIQLFLQDISTINAPAHPPSFAFCFSPPLTNISPLSSPSPLFPPSTPLQPFCSSVCPIWAVTCLIFSRPSSPLCRALLQSPPPTVPGEVRSTHTCIHTYSISTRAAGGRIMRAAHLSLSLLVLFSFHKSQLSEQDHWGLESKVSSQHLSNLKSEIFSAGFNTAPNPN